MYQLLDNIVTKSVITKDQYDTLPTFLQPRVANVDHVYFVVIVPQAITDPNTPCRVSITAAANNRTGTIQLENNGRLPVASPPTNFDDLRPITFYVWGVGTQIFRTRVSNNTSVYKESTVEFE